MSRTLILGGRGAGKSAIFWRLVDHPEPPSGAEVHRAARCRPDQLAGARAGREGFAPRLQWAGRGPSRRHAELRRRLDETKKDYGIWETKPQIINALVEWGALGVQRPNGQTQFIWDVPDGKQPSPSEGDEEDEQESYIVHPSLWSALELRAPRRRKARTESGA
jgi:hypothetical protein